jgi:hypothetical protein
MVMPAEVRLTYSDGANETRRIPIEMWNYGPHHAFTVPTASRRLVGLEVDPRHVYPDMDRGNNRWGSTPGALRAAQPPAAQAPAAKMPAAQPPQPAPAAVQAPAAPLPAAVPPQPAPAQPQPEPPPVTEEAALDMMRSDLEALVQHERRFFEANLTYTRDLAALGFVPSQGVTIAIGYANNRGFRAIARHGATSHMCGAYLGSGTPTSPGAREGEAACR